MFNRGDYVVSLVDKSHISKGHVYRISEPYRDLFVVTGNHNFSVFLSEKTALPITGNKLMEILYDL